jgi:hypothetical protein
MESSGGIAGGRRALPAVTQAGLVFPACRAFAGARMKKILLSLLAGGFAAGAAFAQSSTPLPFSVTLGGVAAVAKDGEAFATVDKPVAADAAVAVGAKADMIIINVSRLAADGTPDSAAQPAVILLQNTQNSSLDKTMDQQKLASGPCLMSITADGQTALVRCTIK